MIVLTTFDLDEYAFAAIRAGASAFLLKDAAPPDLLGAIRVGPGAVTQSSPRAPPAGCSTTSPHCPTPHAPTAHDDRAPALLTEREVEVLTLIARGRTNTEIATDLVVAETTVKTHVGRILAKTGSRDRVQLVVLGYESGLVAP